jgi:hypothetical protein
VTAYLPPPALADALTTAGMLCHFVASDPALTEAFRAWIEHHPGDLDAGQVTWYLGAVHDLLSPDCETPATADFRPERRRGPANCGTWIPCCPCAEHGWVSRLVCVKPADHDPPHRSHSGTEWGVPALVPDPAGKSPGSQEPDVPDPAVAGDRDVPVRSGDAVRTTERSITLIRAERARQITDEGYTAEHDAHHIDGELARAAAAYALYGGGAGHVVRPGYWPWPDWRLTPGEVLDSLVKAAALIVAEMDRLAGDPGHHPAETADEAAYYRDLTDPGEFPGGYPEETDQ